MEQSVNKAESMKEKLIKIDEVTWELPKDETKGMHVPARVIANDKLIESIEEGVFIPNSVQAGIIFAELSKRTRN